MQNISAPAIKTVVSKPISFLKQKLEKEKPKDTSILQELNEIEMQISIMNNKFDIVTQPELIDSCIYQLGSLEAQYNYLLAEARRKGLRCSNFEQRCLKERMMRELG